MGRLVIVLKWKCSPGKKHCEECAKLDGLEFYFFPTHNQRPMEDMPKPPLHPNCTCYRIPIYRYGELSEYFARNGIEIMPGVAFGSDGLMGHYWFQYGNYGGPGWSSGRNADKLPPGYEKIKPIDALDDCFKRHDENYDQCTALYRNDPPADGACKNRADKILLNELWSLPKDPDQRGGETKSETERQAAKVYHSLAIAIFAGKTAMYYIENNLPKN